MNPKYSIGIPEIAGLVLFSLLILFFLVSISLGAPLPSTGQTQLVLTKQEYTISNPYWTMEGGYNTLIVTIDSTRIHPGNLRVELWLLYPDRQTASLRWWTEWKSKKVKIKREFHMQLPAKEAGFYYLVIGGIGKEIELQ